ncbi:MAG: oxidoreductase [Candidatus Hydrogenedentota bacterium]|nr:MAG: oxidoreductase [Candidatus Hydrogenedentota bacterium]
MSESVRRAIGESSVYTPRKAKVESIQPMTPSETLLELRPSASPLRGSPGQFVQVTIPGVGECPISLCSDCRETETFQLCVRRVGLVTTAIHRLVPGSIVGIRGPFGTTFPLEEAEGKDVLLVAGGLGMAPLRSFVEYILKNRDRFGEVTLVYGTRSPKDLLFREEVFEWYYEKPISVILTVDLAPAGDWTGEVGPVTIPLRSLEIVPARTLAVMVGPPVMFSYVLDVLREKGLSDDRIYCSLERRMFCGIGKCGQCQIEDLLCCKDGPVFSLSQIADRGEAL